MRRVRHKRGVGQCTDFAHRGGQCAQIFEREWYEEGEREEGDLLAHGVFTEFKQDGERSVAKEPAYAARKQGTQRAVERTTVSLLKRYPWNRFE